MEWLYNFILEPLLFVYRKVKQRDAISNESQTDKASETCKQVDDHVFVKPAEPKSTIEPKGPEQTKDKVVSV